MIVHLVQPRSPSRYSRGSRDGYNGPLGLASIATSLFAAGHEDVRIFDLEVVDHDVDEVLAADVVGISLTAFTYEPAIELARKAKAGGAMVLLGGPHASMRAEAILSACPDIDGVCVAQGEQVFLDLVAGEPLASVRNLVTRKHGLVRRAPVEWVERDRLPRIDRSHLPMEAYISAFQRIKDAFSPDLPYSVPMGVFSQVGCAFRDRTGGCLFCSRARAKSEMRDAEAYWTEVAGLETRYGADWVWDFSDSFPSDPEWVRQLAAARPKAVRSGMYVYGRADELSPRILDDLAAMEVRQVLMGIETADAGLKENKGTTVADDLSAVRGMRERGIRLFPSYCLGFEGETRESVRRTVEFAKEVAAIGAPHEVACSILIPFIGTAAFVKLTRACPEVASLKDAAYIPPELLQRHWVNTFCEVAWEELVDAMHQILETAPLKSSFGVPVMEDRAPYCTSQTYRQLTMDMRREVARKPS